MGEFRNGVTAVTIALMLGGGPVVAGRLAEPPGRPRLEGCWDRRAATGLIAVTSICFGADHTAEAVIVRRGATTLDSFSARSSWRRAEDQLIIGLADATGESVTGRCHIVFRHAPASIELDRCHAPPGAIELTGTYDFRLP